MIIERELVLLVLEVVTMVMVWWCLLQLLLVQFLCFQEWNHRKECLISELRFVLVLQL